MYKMELEQFTFLFDCHPCWFDIILKEELWKLTIQRLTTNKQKKNPGRSDGSPASVACGSPKD